jgi:hypothetical protein
VVFRGDLASALAILSSQLSSLVVSLQCLCSGLDYREAFGKVGAVVSETVLG